MLIKVEWVMPKVSCLSLGGEHGAEEERLMVRMKEIKRVFPPQSNLSLRYDWRAGERHYNTKWEFDAKII